MSVCGGGGAAKVWAAPLTTGLLATACGWALRGARSTPCMTAHTSAHLRATCLAAPATDNLPPATVCCHLCVCAAPGLPVA